MEQVVAFIGSDWSDAKHDVCLVDTATDRQQLSVISHKSEA